MVDFDFKKCEVCTEKRCDLAFLQKTPEEREEEKFQKRMKEEKRKQLTKKWKSDIEYYRRSADREIAMVKYDRKPYMNDSDWRHDANWFLNIKKMMELDEEYYRTIGNLY